MEFSPQIFDEYLFGRLAEPDRQEFEEKLKTHPEQAKAFEEHRKTFEAILLAAELEQKAELEELGKRLLHEKNLTEKPGLTRTWMWVAAAAVILLLLGLYFFLPSKSSQSTPSLDDLLASHTPAETVLYFLENDSTELGINEIITCLQSEQDDSQLAPPSRAQADTHFPLIQVLDTIQKQLSAREYAMAIKGLRKIAKGTGCTSLEIAIAYLKSGGTIQALEFFAKDKRPSSLDTDKRDFYHALSLIVSGNFTVAQRLLCYHESGNHQFKRIERKILLAKLKADCQALLD